MPTENISGICKLLLIKDDIDYYIEFVVDKHTGCSNKHPTLILKICAVPVNFRT